MLIQKLAMAIHHFQLIHMVVVVRNNFHVIIVNEIYLVHDIYLKMNILFVLNVMKIVLPIHVKNVDEKLVQIQKIFHIKIVIGMKDVFFVQCVKLHLLINHLVVKMINYFVVNVIINNLLHVAINVIKYLNQVNRNFEFQIEINRNFCFRHEKTWISWTTISWTLLYLFRMFTTNWNKKFYSKRSKKLLCSMLWRTFCYQMYSLC
jgi:hypothetical protein